MTCENVTYGASTACTNTITIFSLLIITSVFPRSVSRYIKYPPDQGISSQYLLTVSSTRFDSSISYQCAFEYKFRSSMQKIVYLNSTSIQCIPPDFEFESFVSLRENTLSFMSSRYAQRTLSFILYEPPAILSISVNCAYCGTEEDVSLSVNSLSFTGNIKCQFGSYPANFAIVYPIPKIVICKSPPFLQNSDETLNISISVDYLFWFSLLQSFKLFTAPTFTNVDNLQIPMIGKDYILVIGTSFYISRSFLSCRINCTRKNDMEILYISSTNIYCLNPLPYLVLI